MNSFQMNSVHLTEAGSGTVERCLDSRGRMHVRNQVGKLRIASETGATEKEVSRGLSDADYEELATGDKIPEHTQGSIRFRTDSTGTVMEHLL